MLGRRESFSAVFAAEEGACFLKAVTDDTDATMRSQGVARAFEATESMGLAVLNYLKCLVVIIPTSLAYCQGTASLMPLATKIRTTRASNPRIRRPS